MKIIKGGIVVSAEGSRLMDIAVDGATIARVEQNIEPGPGDERIDAKGCLVFPGFIDAHTHFQMDNGATVTADDFASGTAAAIAGGTTTIVDFATQDKGKTLSEALDAWQHRAYAACSCHYAFHMAITDWNEETRGELDRMTELGVTSYKLYMAYDALRVDDAQMLDIFREMRRVGALCGVHCENGTLVNALIADLREQGRLSPAAIPASRPQEVEAEAVSRLLYIAKLADWPAMVVHLSTALGLQEIDKARGMGQMVLAETCPQYLLMTDEVYRLPGFEGAKFACSPPIREEQDRKALIEAIVDGRIDTVSTDHCSFNYVGQKDLGVGDFSKIPNGLPGVEHRPQLIYTALVDSGLIKPERMCQLLSERPAKLYGMWPRKGCLMPGSDADIVIWQRDIEDVISQKTQIQNVDYTPYEGMKVTGRAKTVLLSGERVVDEGKLIKRGLGKYVARQRPSLEKED